MYVDIVISNVFDLNKHFYFYFLFLMAVVPSPGVTDVVAESLIRDLGRFSEW